MKQEYESNLGCIFWALAFIVGEIVMTRLLPNVEHLWEIDCLLAVFWSAFYVLYRLFHWIIEILRAQ